MTHPSLPNTDPRCSLGALDEPLAGTAPYAQGWLLIAAQGSWGAHAVESHSGKPLQTWAQERGLRIMLVRQHHRDDVEVNKYWISNSRGTLRTGLLSSPGTPPDLGDSTLAEPLLIICTNGARDQCCSIEGIALRKSVQEKLSDSERRHLWEGTHIGGHRFAPTALYLPGNVVYGRLTPEAAVRIMRTGEMELAHLRGRSHYSPCLQVLESRLSDFASIQWLDSDGCPELTHEHVGEQRGKRRIFTLTPQHLAPRPESCGKPAISGISWKLEEKLHAG